MIIIIIIIILLIIVIIIIFSVPIVVIVFVALGPLGIMLSIPPTGAARLQAASARPPGSVSWAVDGLRLNVDPTAPAVWAYNCMV